MVSYLRNLIKPSLAGYVLILIVVEDGLVPLNNKSTGIVMTVLILIVVEDGLVPCIQGYHGGWSYVLILVVVDDGLVLMVIDVEAPDGTKS